MGHPKKAAARKPKYQVLGKKPVSATYRLLNEDEILRNPSMYFQRVRSEPAPEDPVFEAELERVIQKAYDEVAEKSKHDPPRGDDRRDDLVPFGKKSR